MEERFYKSGSLSGSDGSGFFIVSESGKKTSVDKETLSIWSMFNSKTIQEVSDVIISDKSDADAMKSIETTVSQLEKAGLLSKE